MAVSRARTYKMKETCLGIEWEGLVFNDAVSGHQLDGHWHSRPEQLSRNWRNHDERGMRNGSGLVVVVAEGDLLAEAVRDGHLQVVKLG